MCQQITEQFAGHGDGGDLPSPAGFDSLEEPVKGPGGVASSVGGLDQHAPRPMPGPAWRSAHGWREPAGLAHGRVEPDIGDELVGGLEAAEVSDGGHDGHRDGHVHAGDGHQPAAFGIVQRGAGELGVDQFQFLAGEVQLTQQGDRPSDAHRRAAPDRQASAVL